MVDWQIVIVAFEDGVYTVRVEQPEGKKDRFPCSNRDELILKVCELIDKLD